MLDCIFISVVKTLPSHEIRVCLGAQCEQRPSQHFTEVARKCLVIRHRPASGDILSRSYFNLVVIKSHTSLILSYLVVHKV